jgi:uncharacterized delta-60 repeat protein
MRSSKRRSVGIGVTTIVVGLLTPGSVRSAVVEGSLDGSFSGDGRFVVTGTALEYSDDVGVQSTGDIVIAGATFYQGTGWALTRVTRGGDLDTSFGTGGVSQQTFDAGEDTYLDDLEMLPDDTFLVVGSGVVDGVHKAVVARYLPDGELDPTFSGDGVLPIAVADAAYSRAVDVDDDGNIFLAGFATASGFPYQFVAKVSSAGDLVQTFGDGPSDSNDGVSAFGYNGTVNTVNDVAVAPDGSIVVLGLVGSSPDYKISLLKLQPSGNADMTFDHSGDTDGFTTDNPTAGSDNASALVIDKSGRILFVGYGGGPFVSRYTATGFPDTSWAGDGRFTPTGVFLSDIAFQPDGKLVIVGQTAGGSDRDLTVSRLTTSGELDTSFGTAGSTVVGFIATNDDGGTALALTSDGRLVAAGESRVPTGATPVDPAIAVLRYDGTPPSPARTRTLERWSLSRPTLRLSATDDNTGVGVYRVQQRQAGYRKASFSEWTLLTRTNTSSVRAPREPGRTVCYRTRAIDRAGNSGPYGTAKCTAYPVDDRAATASPGWKKGKAKGYYLGTFTSSSQQGAELSLPVAYRHLALVATTCPTCGRVRVTIGSVSVRLSLKSATTRHQVVLPIAAAAKVKKGTLVIQQVSDGHRVTVEGIAVSLR